MGYTTDFDGYFSLDKPLTDKDYEFLVKLAKTRRMKRNVDPIYGVEGEFYTDGKGFCGQEHEDNVVDHNTPPSTQPSLWCQWVPTEDRMRIEWDGNEKFYNYIEWIEYIITSVLAPRGYVLTGAVDWRGEDFHDVGTIQIIDNVVNGKDLSINESINVLLDDELEDSEPNFARLKF